MKQGEIWLIDLVIGSEMQKKRPAVIVNDDALGILPLKIIVPVTDWKDRYQIAPWVERFIKQLGFIDESVLDSIKNALKKIFSLN